MIHFFPPFIKRHEIDANVAVYFHINLCRFGTVKVKAIVLFYSNWNAKREFTISIRSSRKQNKQLEDQHSKYVHVVSFQPHIICILICKLVCLLKAHFADITSEPVGKSWSRLLKDDLTEKGRGRSVAAHYIDLKWLKHEVRTSIFRRVHFKCPVPYIEICILK